MADARATLFAMAQAQVGMRYRLDPPPDGITTTDCSLFVLQTAKSAGLGAGLEGVRTAEQIRQATVAVSWAGVLPGDLLFFTHTYEPTEPAGPDGETASHVGISLGPGTKQMWDAHQRAGEDVAITDISTDYWQSHLLEARRLTALYLADMPTATVEPPKGLLRGIDVASHQGAIDWPAVAASGIAFGITKASGGTWYTNPTLGANWLGMKAAGVARGAYHFAFETSGQAFPGDGPEAEADYFLTALKRAGGIEAGDILALDIEDGNGPLGDWALRWCRRVESASGVKPIVYTGTWFSVPHGFGNVPALADYPLWLAAYQAAPPSAPAPWTKTTIWQHSDEGRVPGISGNVDLNIFNGTRAQLLALGKGGRVEQAAYEVGQGILDAMEANADDPATDELFFKHGERDAWSEAYGTSGARYVWLPATGRVYRYDPAA